MANSMNDGPALNNKPLMGERKMVTYAEPSRREQGAYFGAAAAVSVIIAWAMGEFAGIVVPAEITAAMSVVIGWAAGKWGT